MVLKAPLILPKLWALAHRISTTNNQLLTLQQAPLIFPEAPVRFGKVCFLIPANSSILEYKDAVALRLKPLFLIMEFFQCDSILLSDQLYNQPLLAQY